MKLKKIAALLTVAGLTAPAFATNGMNLEGYGPIATAMGGASTAYDNGTAGMINNAATLGMMQSGTSRLDLAVGGLHPNVSARSAAGLSAQSGGDTYIMPAIGYVRKDGALSWGVGLMSQGGMGTEYGTSSFMSNGSGREVRTELGVGRVMFPLAFDVSSTFKIGGSLDYVWGGLDANINLNLATFGAMFNNGTGGAFAGAFGGNAASDNANKNLVGYATGASFAAGGAGATMLGWAGAGACAVTEACSFQMDFSKGKDKFTQQTKGSAFAPNIGFVWSPTKAFSIGATYRSQVNFGDLSGSAVMTGLNTTGGVIGTMSGTMRVVDFKWPSTTAVGISYQATDKLHIVADFKNTGWKAAMQQFHMKFSNSLGTIDFGLNQNWNDQNVVHLGMSYKVDDAMTLRAGATLGNQVLREQNMTPLFPASVTNGFTLGAGFAVSKYSSIDVSGAFFSKVSLTNNGGGLAGQQGYPAGASTSHSQSNWQAMYSMRF